MAMRDWCDPWERRRGVAARVRVRDIMSWPALALTELASVELALRISVDKRFHHFPILRAGELVGVVCTCDLREAPLAASVKRFMSRQTVTVEPDALLLRAIELMDDESVNCLPTKLHDTWGIITRRDLVNAGACPVQVCGSCGALDHVHLRREGLTWVCSDCIADRQRAVH